MIPSVPTAAELDRQYQEYLDKVEAGLPAGLPDSERERILKEALAAFSSSRIDLVMDQGNAGLSHIYDQILLEAEPHGAVADQAKLDALRSSLTTSAGESTAAPSV